VIHTEGRLIQIVTFALLSKVFGLTNPGHKSVRSNCFCPAKDQVLRTVLLVPFPAAANKVFAIF